MNDETNGYSADDSDADDHCDHDQDDLDRVAATRGCATGWPWGTGADAIEAGAIGDGGGTTPWGAAPAAAVGLPHFGQNLTPASITEPQELRTP